ncbi:MAG: M48 family metallopeptidase [Ignavibacteria bacterium]|nr:M48 family metallopeptidase [Ignavibacteria bacterium]MBT8382747.1 M48 family metallopeptidase [Ignavibacteria bacterium]MBT8392956.1 M48 family metallopeptidase [Ignavibacteria bacterium]NNJ53889.1 M48 family metalloprotease [Ignavibacteriaceae bacterium]NNL19743.1 M48 family metalloprotease [Ignavibacteriaceae bacterium]
MKENEVTKSANSVKSILFSFMIFFSANITVNAQDDFLKELLNTADILNETLLEVTALSDDEENSIGIELEKQILSDMRVVRERKFDLKKIFNDMMSYVDRTNINYGYKVVSTDEVNAYAIAGGRMFFNTGILDFLETEDEIAFVMAHEIAHNELRHCIKRVQYAAIASSIDPSFGEIVQLAYGIYSMPFTKYDEYEADELGVWLMKKAGYDKQGAVDFFTKLEELEKEYGIDERDAVNDFISSHPTARDRRDRVKNM